MKAVIGLGNPGAKYQDTRHNVGWQVLAELARRWQGDRPKLKFNAEIVEAVCGSERVLLVAPQTFMNLSGRSVQPLATFYSLEMQDLLVVCDDLNLDPGRLRIRAAGSAGGQKGLADIIQKLGSDQVPRLRVGIGRPPANWDAADYVLGRFRGSEVELIENAVREAAEAAEVWVREGVDAAMNRFNGGEGTKGPRDKGAEGNGTSGGRS